MNGSRFPDIVAGKQRSIKQTHVSSVTRSWAISERKQHAMCVCVRVRAHARVLACSSMCASAFNVPDRSFRRRQK